MSKSKSWRWIAALVACALYSVPAPVIAQQEDAESATLQLTSESKEAARHFKAGLEHQLNINNRGAASDYEKALELDPNFGLARVMLGVVQPGLRGAERRAEIAKGIEMMGASSTPEMLVALAWKEQLSGNGAAARTLLTSAEQLVPDDASVVYIRAILGTGNAEDAIARMRKVAERFPEFAAAHNVLGYQLWAAGDHDGALKAIRRYVELMPDHPNPHDSYAELLQWDGRLQEAAAHYGKALELDETFEQAHFGLAEIAQLTGHTEEARRHIEMAIASAPSEQARINYRRALANHYLMNGDRKSAATELEAVATEARAAELDGLATIANQQLAVIDAMGNGRSIDIYLAAAAETGGEDNPGQYAWSAMAHAIAGSLIAADESATALEAAAENNPGLATVARSTRAVILLAQNRADDALTELQSADPSDDLVRSLMAECFNKTGRRDEARAFKSDVLTNRNFSFLNPVTAIARVRASKI